MPGVPSSRGCDACRQQKKKCDQLRPLCSRCARLEIPCTGSGQRRYRFLSQQPPTAASGRSSAAGSSMQPPTRAPSNQMSLDASHFISALQVTDVRFDLRIYGPFFPDLPRRLGRNKAFDASVRALAVAFPSVHTRQCTPDMYKTYGEALACLRTCLGDPATAGSVETLCAVYLTIICQGWIGRGGDFFPSHSEAIAHMLNSAAAAQNWQGQFEAEVTNTLLFIVLLESLSNHKIKLDPRLWTPSRSPAIARPARPPADAALDIECLKIPTLAAVSAYTRDVAGNLPAIKSTYDILQTDLAKMKMLLSGVSGSNIPAAASWTRARRQTGYGTLLLLGLMANWALTAFRVGDVSALMAERVSLVDEVMELAQRAVEYRPLAASAMPGFIMAAKVMTDDAVRLARLDELLALYQSDFHGSG
ncbi:hypothetical protein QBC47DRAFT_438281 [Echria macrotheca]|uniref:Zn(2)-C6 fungal-type domain-containing protein n=1 Tax=Echria macrotheca TaxID=438768 RepID=A0AAJ0BKM1_9PEZI|nr:hypothetical protein QBC47DRAFT_438281 [Echria macrotheca]